MSETPVTQALYHEVMEQELDNNLISRNPITNVSWFDAIEFCNRLSILHGQEAVYERHLVNFSSNLCSTRMFAIGLPWILT